MTAFFLFLFPRVPVVCHESAGAVPQPRPVAHPRVPGAVIDPDLRPPTSSRARRRRELHAPRLQVLGSGGAGASLVLGSPGGLLGGPGAGFEALRRPRAHAHTPRAMLDLERPSAGSVSCLGGSCLVPESLSTGHLQRNGGIFLVRAAQTYSDFGVHCPHCCVLCRID